uniref:Uncharacterized protein n=1 Tax=Anopheles atroparvus TaxID=41427 RepID=A0A182J5L7_ANOAO
MHSYVQHYSHSGILLQTVLQHDTSCIVYRYDDEDRFSKILHGRGYYDPTCKLLMTINLLAPVENKVHLRVRRPLPAGVDRGAHNRAKPATKFDQLRYVKRRGRLAMIKMAKDIDPNLAEIDMENFRSLLTAIPSKLRSGVEPKTRNNSRIFSVVTGAKAAGLIATSAPTGWG